MNRDEKLARLREEYGKEAIEAYDEIRSIRLYEKNASAVFEVLHYVFEKFGVTVTGAALQFHAEQEHEMASRVNPEDAARAARLVKRVAAMCRSEQK